MPTYLTTESVVLRRYQDYRADEIPIVKNDRFFLKVFAGESHGVRGPIEMRNPGMVLDVQLQPGASFDQYVSVYMWLRVMPTLWTQSTCIAFSVFNWSFYPETMHLFVAYSYTHRIASYDEWPRCSCS